MHTTGTYYNRTCDPLSLFETTIFPDARRLFFSDKNVTWAWKFVCPSYACQSEPTRFKIDIYKCSTNTTPLETNYTTLSSITIPHSSLAQQMQTRYLIIHGSICENCSMYDYSSFGFEIEHNGEKTLIFIT